MTLVAGLSMVIAVAIASFGHPWLSSAASTMPSSSTAVSSTQPPFASDPVSSPPMARRGPPDQADGVLPNDATVFDEAYPGIAGLDPDLLRTLRQAATDAADDGVELIVESGWRSSAYQARLLREAISQYGSEDEAARWVATPGTSPHVSGDAVDVGPLDARAWLSEHGAAFGLCQIYRNEPWHFELRPSADDLGCPRMYADAAHDPRMQH